MALAIYREKTQNVSEGGFSKKEFSSWYINPYYENKKGEGGYYLHRYREPLLTPIYYCSKKVSEIYVFVKWYSR